MNGFSLELPLTIIATLGAALAVTSARRGAWIALIIAATAVALLEFHPTDAVPLTLVLRLAAIYGGANYEEQRAEVLLELRRVEEDQR